MGETGKSIPMSAVALVDIFSSEVLFAPAINKVATPSVETVAVALDPVLPKINLVN